MNSIDFAISQTLASWHSSLFVWGRADCCLSPADYIKLLTGKDPAKAWRGAYSDKEGAYAFIKAAGGVDKLVDTGMMSIGAKRVGMLRRGDIIVAKCRDFDLVGIFKDPYAAFRSEAGGVILSKKLPIIGAWRA